FLTTPLAHQYRLIVETLALRQSVSLTGVGHDELLALVVERLPEHSAAELVEELNLDARLDSLVGWGTVEAWQDRAETEADFLRNRSRYQLTEAGAFLHRMAEQLDTDVGVGSTAALMAPGSLADRLSATLRALEAGDSSAASTEYAQVETTLASMSASASSWQSKLAAALGGPPEEARITRLLETILAYVEAWGSGVDAYSAAIGLAVPRLEALPPETWRRLALARLQTSAPEDALAGAVSEMLAVVATLRHWFCGPSPQAQRLRRQMRDAVAPVLRGHRTLLAVGGTVSRKADLVKLAHAIESAPDAGAAWRIWAGATSLYPARHLRVPAPEPDEPLRTGVWVAPPAAVSSRLRAQGQRSLTGRAPRMPDTSAARAEARRLAVRERAELARAEAELAQRSGTDLSTWAPLNATETGLFLDLLSAARDNREADGSMAGISADGRWRLRLWPTTPGRPAVLRTPNGRLVLADARVEITS
ncbi:MAG TPA: DUF2397 domain-containing protein, partial [Propionicimonas sp.]|nr:DUF2397 domain-containing protein [Propionicimonas sp.]